MSGDPRDFGRPEEGVRSLEGGASNTSRKDSIRATRREEREGTGLDPRCALSEYCREYGGVIDVGHFSAVVMDGENFVL